MRRFALLVVTAALAAALGAGCSSDDGTAVRNSASSDGLATVSQSGSGISRQVTGTRKDDPLVLDAIAEYKSYVLAQVDEMVVATTVFTNAVRRGDVEAAKAAYAPSRQGWERIEPIAGLVSELDGSIDARVDDFESHDDPTFTGWHRLEYMLWESNTTEGAAEFANRLDADLHELRATLTELDIPPAALAVGAGELIEEVSTGKLTGEEDRYSHTDLWDFAANVAGAKVAFDLLTPALQVDHLDLVNAVNQLFTELDAGLDTYRSGDGYHSYEALTDADRSAMQATLSDLSERLSVVAGALGLA